MKLPIGCNKVNNEIRCTISGKELKMISCEWQLGQGSSCRGKDGNSYEMPDAIFRPDFDKKVDSKSYAVVKTMERDRQRIDAYEKELYFAGHLSDLGDTGDKSVIVNLYDTKMTVRRIDVEKDSIIIDVCDGNCPLKFPKDLEVYYEPWFMDRGSFVFLNPTGNEYPSGTLMKLATEGDIMREQ
jgi:hypothetical protein